MADRIESKKATIPAGTSSLSPVTIAFGFDDGQVDMIDILIPPGPSGLVGFAIVHSSQPVIPYTAGDWIIGDDEKLPWPLSNFPTGGKWSLIGYNSDVYDHTIYVRFLITEVTPTVTGPVGLVPIV